MAISKKNLAEAFARPVANLLILSRKIDLQSALEIIVRQRVNYLCFGTSIFIQAEDYNTTLVIEDNLKQGSFFYAFILISNPDGSWLSAPHLKPADASLIRDLLLIGSIS